MIEKLNMTVAELAAWLERKDFIWRGNLGENVTFWKPFAARMLAADALYEALVGLRDGGPALDPFGDARPQWIAATERADVALVLADGPKGGADGS